MHFGFVYVLVSGSLDGLVKIGNTTGQPEDRARDLSAATGVPSPFIVAFSQAFEDCKVAERKVHTLLELKGHRPNAQREFFKISPTVAIQTILAVAAERDRDVSSNEATNSDVSSELIESVHQNLYLQGLDLEGGLGDALQDADGAIKLYTQAALLGSANACFRLGLIYQKDRATFKEAIRYLTRGCDLGLPICYCELAWIYNQQDNAINVTKCWDRFFAADTDLDDTNVLRLPHYFSHYVYHVRARTASSRHATYLKPFFDEIHEILLETEYPGNRFVGDYADWLIRGTKFPNSRTGVVVELDDRRSSRTGHIRPDGGGCQSLTFSDSSLVYRGDVKPSYAVGAGVEFQTIDWVDDVNYEHNIVHNVVLID